MFNSNSLNFLGDYENSNRRITTHGHASFLHIRLKSMHQVQAPPKSQISFGLELDLDNESRKEMFEYGAVLIEDSTADLPSSHVSAEISSAAVDDIPAETRLNAVKHMWAVLKKRFAELRSEREAEWRRAYADHVRDIEATASRIVEELLRREDGSRAATAGANGAAANRPDADVVDMTDADTSADTKEKAVHALHVGSNLVKRHLKKAVRDTLVGAIEKKGYLAAIEKKAERLIFARRVEGPVRSWFRQLITAEERRAKAAGYCAEGFGRYHVQCENILKTAINGLDDATSMTEVERKRGPRDCSRMRGISTADPPRPGAVDHVGRDHKNRPHVFLATPAPLPRNGNSVSSFHKLLLDELKDDVCRRSAKEIETHSQFRFPDARPQMHGVAFVDEVFVDEDRGGGMWWNGCEYVEPPVCRGVTLFGQESPTETVADRPSFAATVSVGDPAERTPAPLQSKAGFVRFAKDPVVLTVTLYFAAPETGPSEADIFRAAAELDTLFRKGEAKNLKELPQMLA